MNQVRVWMAAVVVAAAIGLIFAAGPGTAGDAGPANGDVKKIADAVKAGKTADAKTMAVAANKKYAELEDVMTAFKTKKKGGLGWTGSKEGDGIELKIREVARDGGKTAGFYEEIGNTIAAVGLIAEARTPAKDKGKATVKGWKAANEEMLEGAAALAKAKSAAELKAAATKINNACNACHSEWRN
jgi:hypothetical protein